MPFLEDTFHFDVDYLTSGDAEQATTVSAVGYSREIAIDKIRYWFEERKQIVFRMRMAGTGEVVYLAKGQDW